MSLQVEGVTLPVTWTIPLACAMRYDYIQQTYMTKAQLLLEQLGWIYFTGCEVCLQFLPRLQRIQ